ncbi:choline-sulfatase [Prosthecobacter fusiformis]|uniref:Choline-sulfatase n=1 Tax=Prosthecobacter fusiformis TaxID=48464 RepID=A0A4R7S6A1_9BACT|nr:sulfatase [Prosthecobacter fusiformis]TDU73196.1 choline-sulfatase [Prosthecobacter fusiformis]
MFAPGRFLLFSLCFIPLASPAAAKVKTRSAAGKPNVLFIIADDLRDYVGWMGGHPQTVTPNMDRLAKMGMRFTNAHCNFALCNPSRTSLLTGMLPSSSGVFGNEQDWRRSVQLTDRATLPEHFKNMGFATAAGGKIFHANHGGPDGLLTGWHGGRRGFEQDAAWETRFPEPGIQIPDMPIHTGQNFNGLNIWHWDWGQINVPDELTDDGAVTTWAAGFLRQKSRKPFFLSVGLYRPHSPWYVPQKYYDMFPLEIIRLPEVKADDLEDVPAFAKTHDKPGGHHELILKNAKWKEAVRGYLASVAFCDAMLGQLLDALASGPNAKNTIVVFTSDHGWYLGEKKMWHKGRLWEEATRIPLTIYAPGITKEDTVSDQPVSLIDLYPTLCDLVKVTRPEHLDGQSLLPLLRDPSAKSPRPAVTTMGGGDRASYAARSDRWRYIRYADGSEELYDHQNDPHEWTNVASEITHEAVKKDLAAFFPKEFKQASRTAEQIGVKPSDDGSLHLKLQIGDELPPQSSPQIQGRGLFIDTVFDYNPLVDANSTLVSQGSGQMGWALHLVAGKPTLSIFVDGKTTSITGDGLLPGSCNVRAMIDADGLMSMAVPGRSEVLAPTPFANGFPSQPQQGMAAGLSFGPLSREAFPNSTPWDGKVQRLRITIMPPKETVAQPGN